MTSGILRDSSSAWRRLPGWSRELSPLRKRSRRRRRGRGRTYLGKMAHPPHPACYPREEGRSLSQPGVVSSPLGESPSPPNWIFQGLRALSVSWRSERRGSAPVHCLRCTEVEGRGRLLSSKLEPIPGGSLEGPGLCVSGRLSAVSPGWDSGCLLHRHGWLPFPSASKVPNCLECVEA